jgi:hypothetical protein
MDKVSAFGKNFSYVIAVQLDCRKSAGQLIGVPGVEA